VRARHIPARHNAGVHWTRGASILLLGAAALASGCATRSRDVPPSPTSPAEFATWSCERIDDETETVQRRAAGVAYAVDERGGNNVVALGLGLSVFWPALLAMRPEGLEAAELARLKGRYEALGAAAVRKGCPPPRAELSASRAAALSVALGERLLYEDRAPARRGGRRPPAAVEVDGPAVVEWQLTVVALRRGDIEYRGRAGEVWRHDSTGNVIEAPDGALQWPQLLRGELVLGHVVAGDIALGADPMTRARVRGQVVAVGPQTVAGRRFDAAVVELFGDAQRGDSFTRLEGALVVDRASGVLLRLDLRSGEPGFALQRRLLRIDGP
jgi:hypothetical protein